jgi:hypothetical protein
MSIADLIRRMSEAGASAEAIAIAVDAIEARDQVDQQRREYARDKKRRQRAGLSRDSEGTNGGNPPSSPIPLDPPSQTLPPIIPQTPSPTEPQKRARRLADDWVLPAGWGKWALTEGWPEATIRLQAEIFADFWQAKGGQGATKLDWFKTWKVWMRKVPKTAPRINWQQRERTIIDAIDERLERDNADIFSALRTIDVEPARREPSTPDLRLVADASRH